jgi:alkaline phosphatase D
MTSTRRRFLERAAAFGAASAPPLWLADCATSTPHAIAAPAITSIAARTAIDVPRFDLGVASGHPTGSSVVLWTRLVGADLPERVEVRWEVAHDESFQRPAARGVETAEAAWGHSVHAEPTGLEPGRAYWYRFNALGDRSTAGRTRTAPAAHTSARLRFAIASCQKYDSGHYAAWRDVAESDLDLVMFLGDYIYETSSRPDALRRHETGYVKTLEGYRARYATYKHDPLLQAAHASCPWLLVWDDHEVDNDYAGLHGKGQQPDFAAQRAAAYQAYWEHMPFPKAARPRLDVAGASMRITSRLDWGRLARIHCLDDRQYRDAQVCPRPGQGGSNTVSIGDCPALIDPARSLLGTDQEQWLAEGWDVSRPWNLVAQQTLMARHSWRDASQGDGLYWTDGWDGYAASRNRMLGIVDARKVPGVVVLGGDVHSHVVADLKADYDRSSAPVIATEFCGTSISSPGLPQDRIDAARPFNPHIHHSRGDQRGTMRFTLDAQSMQVELRVVDDVADPLSAVRTDARFAVDSERPGAQRA